MKKFVALMCVVTAAVSVGSDGVQACDGHNRVIYSASPVTYSTPVVRTYPVVHSTPAVRTTTVVSRPITVSNSVLVSRTIEKKDVIEIERRIKIENGSVVKAKVRFAGTEQGEVTVRAGDLELQCPIMSWSPNQVTFQMPAIEFLDDADVTLTIFKATGSVAKKVDAVLLASPDFKIESPGSSLATAHAAVAQ